MIPATRIRVEPGASFPGAYVEHGGASLRLHSGRDPHGEADRLLEERFPPYSSGPLVVIGLGLGFLLEALDRRGYGGGVVALEPDAGALEALRGRRATSAWLEAGRLVLLGPSEWPGSRDLWRVFGDAADDPVVLVHPVLARTHHLEVAAARAVIGRALVSARANAEARRANAGRYLLNTIRNREAIARERDAAALDGKARELATLVVAAGPSLDDNLTAIAAYRDRVLLIACDTALRPLLAAGVHPDLVVAVDPSEANARHLTDLPPCPDTYLVAEGSLDTEALRAFEGRTFFFRIDDHHPWPWLRAQGVERGRLRAWGSVLTSAFDLALRMGSAPVVFAGADLAFTGGRPYARHTINEEEWRRHQAWGQTLEEVWQSCVEAWPAIHEPGVGGAQHRTASHLLAFRDWLAAEAAASGRSIVNGTGAGILVGEAIAEHPLNDILSSLPPLAAAHRRIGVRIAAAARVANGADAPEPGRSGASRSLVTGDVRAAWVAFAGVSEQAIDDALDCDRRRQQSPVSAAPPYVHASERDTHDDEAIARLRSTAFPLLLIEHTRAGDDLESRVREALAAMSQDGVVAIIDRVDLAAGAQVRRVADVLLSQRPDLRVTHHRFTHPASRLTVLRADALRQPADPQAADREKWRPEHAEVAERLVPFVVGHLRPRSIVDLGCGAGYWLDVFARSGVTPLRGITPRPDGEVVEAVRPVVARGDLSRLEVPAARADVVLSLEVARYYPPDRHRDIVAGCVAHADVVVFSSAPPGGPVGSPFDRPLPYWAALFLEHGYVLEDGLRQTVERHWGSTRTLYDGLVVFRRALEPGHAAPPALLEALGAHAWRIQDLFMQAVWHQVAARKQTSVADVPVVTACVDMTLPPYRVLPVSARVWRFRFRSDAARWYLAHPAMALEVLENGRSLPKAARPDQLETAAGWHLTRDDLLIAAGDGSNPRVNGRRYAVRLPAFVAREELAPASRLWDEAL